MDLQKISDVFIKDLNRLSTEVNSYSTQADLWQIGPGIVNSGGNLALHILGNLQHFVGKILGGTDYLRDRPAEFSSKDISKGEILAIIETTKSVIIESLGKLSSASLEEPYPDQAGFGPDDMTNLQALVILAAHLNYHLGQINYHRRLL